MPVSTTQADRINTYYSKREDYNKLLYEAAAEAPPNRSTVHPLPKKKAEEKKEGESEEPKQPENEGPKEPKPGEFLRELVDNLEKHRISGPGGPKFAAGGDGSVKAEGKGKGKK